MLDNNKPDSPPVPRFISGGELADRQHFIAKRIPLVMKGSHVTIDEAIIEDVAALEPFFVKYPIPPEQVKELKDKLKAQFNAAAKPLPFDGRELEQEASPSLRTVVMASPEMLAKTYPIKEKVEIFEDWFCVRHALVSAGAHVEIVPQTLRGGGLRTVYTRDRYVVVGDTAYLPDPDFVTPQNIPNMADLAEYQAEIIQIEKTLRNLGVNTVIVKDAWFEGGNVVRHYSSNTIFFGLDDRTFADDAEKLIKAVNATQPKKWALLPVPLTNMADMYHLDTGMSEELPRGEVMLSSEVTDAGTFEKIRAIVGSKNIIPLSSTEAANLATNMIDVGNTLVMTGNCAALRADLVNRGYKVIMPADYGRDTFELGGGGVHCMTNDMRQPARRRPRKALTP